MAQNLRSTFSLKAHRTGASRNLPARNLPVYNSLESLLLAMQQVLQTATNELLQPRPQAVNRILLEAAKL